MATQKHRSTCPLNVMLEKLGDKWSLLILRDAILFDKRRYSEFLSSPENISTNILANRLKRLQADHILEKFPDPDDGKASLYIPTEHGLRVLPMMMEAMRWGMAECGDVGMPEFAANIMKTGSARYIKVKSALLADERRALSHP